MARAERAKDGVRRRARARRWHSGGVPAGLGLGGGNGQAQQLREVAAKRLGTSARCAAVRKGELHGRSERRRLDAEQGSLAGGNGVGEEALLVMQSVLLWSWGDAEE